MINSSFKRNNCSYSNISEVIYEPLTTIKIITKQQQSVTILTCKQARQVTEFISRFLDVTPKVCFEK